MKLSKEKLMAEAASTGYRPEMLEKVIRLLELLEGFRSHPFLKKRLVLKGGTALNVFQFELPRLSVDIDLNYVGSPELEVMKKERPDVERAIADVCNRADLRIERTATEHAGGKWRLRYDSALGAGANLEVDLNYLLRLPLWTIVTADSHNVGSFTARQIDVLDINEIACAKLVALLSRHAARDLFDAHLLLSGTALDYKKLRLGFVLYGAASRKDWRTVAASDVGFEPAELKQNLIPVLNAKAIEKINDEEAWARRLVEECQAGLARLLPLSDNERAFLDALLDRGEIDGALLTDEPDFRITIQSLPMLQWKARNVRLYKTGKAEATTEKVDPLA
jgi:predicted nucleotidyltransferase component of viral defense system